jgi:hypothetical protein
MLCMKWPPSSLSLSLNLCDERPLSTVEQAWWISKSGGSGDIEALRQLELNQAPLYRFSVSFYIYSILKSKSCYMFYGWLKGHGVYYMWMGFSFHETKCLSVGLAFFATIFQPQTIYIYIKDFGIFWSTLFLPHFPFKYDY